MKFLGVLSLFLILLFGCSTKAVNTHEWNEPPTGEILMGTIFFNVEGDQDQIMAAGRFILDNFDGSVAYQGLNSNFYVVCETVEQIDSGNCKAMRAKLIVAPWSGPTS